jgi:hypothetical protein
MNRPEHELEELRERAAAYRDLRKTMRPLRYYLWIRTVNEAGPLLEKAMSALAVVIGISIAIAVFVVNCNQEHTPAKALQEAVAHEAK